MIENKQKEESNISQTAGITEYHTDKDLKKIASKILTVFKGLTTEHMIDKQEE